MLIRTIFGFSSFFKLVFIAILPMPRLLSISIRCLRLGLRSSFMRYRNHPRYCVLRSVTRIARDRELLRCKGWVQLYQGLPIHFLLRFCHCTILLLTILPIYLSIWNQVISNYQKVCIWGWFKHLCLDDRGRTFIRLQRCRSWWDWR